MTARNLTEAMRNFPIKKLPDSISNEVLSESVSVKFAKETHAALNDPLWQWTGSTAFSDVWCWLPECSFACTDWKDYVCIIKFVFSVKIGFRNTGRKTNFFVRISSLDIDYSNWSYVADLDVAAESVSIDNLINTASESAYALLAKHLPEINAKKAAFLETLT